MSSAVRLSTFVLLLVGTADLLMTILWLKNGGSEGNLVFAWIAQFGLFALIAAKMAFLAGPVALLEYARRSHPRTAEVGTWVATALYLVLLAAHVHSSNG